MSEQSFSIGELSKEFDITPRSIRFYEEQGLLSPERQGQSRIYGKKDRVRLKLILRGKRLGFSLAETKTLFELYDTHQNSQEQLETMMGMIQDKRQVLTQQLDDIKNLLNELDEAELRCKDELKELNTRESSGPENIILSDSTESDTTEKYQQELTSARLNGHQESK